VIYCPISKEFQPKQKLFNCSCPRILQVGTTENKNLSRVAQALRGLSCRLSIVGPLSAVQKKALEENKIVYENHVGLSREALVYQYQEADIVMFASLYEGFGLPIIEANAIGRPVITSNLHSMPEVGANAACYVNPYNIGEIRSALNRLIDDSNYRQEIVNNGFQNVERFRLAFIAGQYADLYRRLADA